MLKLGVWRLVRVNNQQFPVTAAEQAVHLDLATLDAEDGAGAGVDCIVLDPRPVANDYDDLLVGLGADERLQPCDPVPKHIHVRLVGGPAEQASVLARLPGHGQDDEVALCVEDVERELEGVEGRLELVGAGNFVRGWVAWQGHRSYLISVAASRTKLAADDETIGSYKGGGKNLHIPMAVCPALGRKPSWKPSPSRAHVSSVG